MREFLVVVVVFGIVGGAYYFSRPTATPYSSGTRSYKIQIGDKQAQGLRADRIERKDGCVLFYRQDRLDTIICEGMGGTLFVTEVYD